MATRSFIDAPTLEGAVIERLQVGKARVVFEEAKRDRANRSISVFGYDHLGEVLLFRLVVEFVLAMDEHNNVLVQLDRSRFTQVGKLRPVAVRLSIARESCDSAQPEHQLAGQ